MSVRDVFSNFSIAASGSNAFQFSVAAVSGTKLQTKLMLLALGIAGFSGSDISKRRFGQYGLSEERKRLRLRCQNGLEHRLGNPNHNL